MIRTLLVMLTTLLTIACTVKNKDSLVTIGTSLTGYAQEISNFRAERIAALTAPKGWLSVSGLYWLEEGINSLGAGEDNHIVLPHITEETIGAYQRTGNDIFFGKVEGVSVTTDGMEYDGGPVSLSYPPITLHHDPLYWYLIRREDKIGVRLLDTLAETRQQFRGIPYYEVDSKFRFRANVVPAVTEDSVAITNVLGQTSNYQVAAYLNFTIAERAYSLTALDEGGDRYFVIFSDETTGESTYGGGRFLYPAKPCDSCAMTTVLDFNRAENPPCAFSDFATCPLPPEKNHIDIAIAAGEKSYDKH